MSERIRFVFARDMISSIQVTSMSASQMSTNGEQRPLDYSVIGEPLNNLLKAVGHKLSREWPNKYAQVKGGRELFVIHIRIARLTYLSALYLGGDKPYDPLRLPEFCTSLPVLNRSLLDSLLTILFILENVPDRIAWFYEADWRELRLELDRFTTEYGHLEEFHKFLRDLAEHCNTGIAHANLTPEQRRVSTTLRHMLTEFSEFFHLSWAVC
jgi:hypothetical protein